MVLKSFTINGFKSFPDRTELKFSDGVCAVVGPNGSGKSNVAEAARWVLGEQNARALRCDKRMEELIFHGAENRSPVSMCEVSLTLDNTGRLFPPDEDEVTVTRRLYRSGESEYLINGGETRLKDVLEIFLGTGLSRDGYAIIGQGRIAEILSDKSADRRRVFEEAAGISRFRARKENAERDLAASDENLTRIKDKIDELQLQREPLREAAEKAKRHAELSAELRGIEVSLWLGALDKTRAETDKARRDAETAKARLEDGKLAHNVRSARAEELAERCAEGRGDAEKARETVTKADLSIADAENDVKLILADIARAEEYAARLRSELDGRGERVRTLADSIKEREGRLAVIEGAERELETSVTALLKSGGGDELAEAERRFEALRAAAAASELRAAELRAELRAAVSSREEAETRRGNADAELAAFETRRKDAENRLSGAEKTLAEVTEERESLQNVYDGLKLRMENRRRKAGETLEASRAAERRHDGLTDRIKLLENFEREYEGFPRAVKAVMTESSKYRLKGIVGTVAELIRADDDCTLAIETALGAALQHIVVETENDAEAAVLYLKNGGIGRATFLPITSVNGQRADTVRFEREPGFIGLACDLVRYDGRLDGVVRQLLGRTAVADDMRSARYIARESGFRLRVVTTDGQLYNAGGSITGGANVQNAGTLSRFNELERLREDERKEREKRVNAQTRLREAEREAEAAEYEFNNAADEIRAADAELAAKREELNAAKLAAEHLAETFAAASKERGVIDGRINALREAEKKTEAAAGKSDTEKRGFEREAELIRAETENIRLKSAEGAEELTKLRERRAELQAERTGIRTAIAETRKHLEELSGDRADAERGAAEQELVSARLREKLKAAEAETDKRRENREELENRRRDFLNSLTELENERGKAERLTRETADENNRLEKELIRLEAKLEASRGEEAQILERLWEKYNLTHTDALKIRTEIDNAAAANRKSAELSKSIAALGEVNPAAVADFERIDSRYAQLYAQSTDALEAKAKISAILEEIVAEMRLIFDEKFSAINETFRTTCTDIFGGGEGFLELDDPEDILGCGIEIRVRPPGKRLGSLSPLSGGEKSLVAIALYFAIFKVNPAPFCFLDEVDHDLDDVNVARYASYLRRMSGSLQFIVITHRRGTMETADYLYGVTSEMRGVSKVLSLNVSEAEKMALK